MLSEHTKQLLNEEKYIAARDKWFSRLEDFFMNNDQKGPLYITGTSFSSEIDPYSDLESWMDDVLEMIPKRIDRILDEEIFRPLCVEIAFFGVHFIDKIFGADVYFKDDQWYNRYLNIEVGQLEKPDLENNEIWKMAQRAALLFMEKGVKLPLFGTPIIASALNIAVNLFGEEILVSMCIEPELALHDLNIINEVLLEIHQWYRNNIPLEQFQPTQSWYRTQPRGYGQICGCTTQLISGSLYEEMIAPLDRELLGCYPNGGMIHLCGSHEQHISVWSKMKELKAVQLNDRAAADLEKYFTGLREDQMIYLMPCEEMTVEEAVRITGGKRLVIIDYISGCD